MRPVTYTRPLSGGGTATTRAWDVDLPGLLVIEVVDVSADGRNVWLIVHAATGYSVSCYGYAEPEGAVSAAQRVAKVADWTRTIREITAIPGLVGAISDATYDADVQIAAVAGDTDRAEAVIHR